MSVFDSIDVIEQSAIEANRLATFDHHILFRGTFRDSNNIISKYAIIVPGHYIPLDWCKYDFRTHSQYVNPLVLPILHDKVIEKYTYNNTIVEINPPTIYEPGIIIR